MLRFRQKPWFIWGFLVGITFSAHRSQAQYTANSQTNLISGVTSNWPGSYYVGNTNFADALLIESNGVLNSGTGCLGYSSTSSNNSALVTGSGSAWNSGTGLYLGYSGAGNSLIINKGGKVVSGSSYLGYYNASSSNNSVVVTDTGSVWSNGSSYFYVGYLGAGNSLVISNGGQVLGYVGYCYLGGMSSSSNNSALVTGSGSVWNNSGNYLGIGIGSGGNSLVISNGGRMVSTDAVVGGPTQPRNTNNTVCIVGAGSVWTNTAGLTFGNSGPSNRLVIADGGKLLSYGGTVGSSLSSSNSVFVTGSGSVWSNGSDFWLGYDGAGNTLIISNGGQLINNGGTVGFNSSSSSNSVAVSGTGSVWNSGTNLYLGTSGPRNSLVISNGGRVANGYCYVGYNSTSGNNSVLVSGNGSVWSNNGTLTFGYSGAGNTLVIANAGGVVNSNCYVGYNNGNNSVLVNGSGSVWSNNGTLTIGYWGWNNNLIITNSGQVIDSYGRVGELSSSIKVVVTGASSLWSNRNDLYIGVAGTGNSLVISAGGQVINRYGYVGYSYNAARNNSVLVTGAGSVWSNGYDLYIGDGGPGSSLVISNGAQVANRTGYVGYNSGTNSVRAVDGGVWQGAALVVGGSGSSNSLIVAGGTVFATNLVIGAASPSCDNWVQLDSGSVYVTNATGDAVLEVRNGSLILNGGTLQVDVLVMTNACGLIVPQGGTFVYRQLVLDPNLSALGDGIPNGWKQQYGFDPLDPIVASADTDGDGFSNLQKYLAGFNPTNAAACLHVISVATSGTNITVTYLGASGDTNYVSGIQSRTNVLDFTTGDASGNYTNGGWQDTGQTNILGVGISVTGGEGTGLGTVTNMTDVGGVTSSTTRYYRVRVLVP